MSDRKLEAGKHTPGPWAWWGNTKNREIYLATTWGGRNIVMSFIRWGMGGAQPCFYADGLREPVEKFVTFEVEYRKDIEDIDHPDARLIAAAPELLAALKIARDALKANEDISGTWALYQASPEMKAINSALEKAERIPAHV